MSLNDNAALIELSRLETAVKSLPELGIADMESVDINSIDAAREVGHALWQTASEQVQQGKLDDRPLYWRRLAIQAALSAQRTLSHQVLDAFDQASRNYEAHFDPSSDLRVLVTGFDPFHLDTDIRQSNPSGVLALLLDGQRLLISGKVIEIRTLIVPVRFRDFDEGLIEQILNPYLADIDLLITVSMGRMDFDLERFPGRRRSSETQDNCRHFCGGTAKEPLVPPGLNEYAQSPEFVEFSLPVAEMLTVTGDFVVNDNRTVTTLEAGEHKASSLENLIRSTSVRGSGGGYLSNEISYRAIREVGSSARQIPVGHIHTPRVDGFDAARILQISDQGRRLVVKAAATLV